MTRYLELDDALRVVTRLGFPVRALKAAVVLESITRKRPLIDGNKRLSWTLASLLLWINGFRLEMPVDTAFDLVLGVARGERDADAAADIIRIHARQL